MENSPWRRWHFPFDVEACTRELLDQGQGEYVLWCVVGVMDCDLLQAVQYRITCHSTNTLQ